MNQKQKQVYQQLEKLGYSQNQIAGIMANISVETGGSFDYTVKQKGGKGYGLFQFDFLKSHYDKYLKKNDLKDSSQSQINFMHSTIKGQNKHIIGEGNAEKINQTFKTGTVPQIAQIFCKIWQKPGIPHIQRRLEQAKTYEKNFNKPELQSSFGMQNKTLTHAFYDGSKSQLNVPNFNSSPNSITGLELSRNRLSDSLSNSFSNGGHSFNDVTRIFGEQPSGSTFQLSNPISSQFLNSARNSNTGLGLLSNSFSNNSHLFDTSSGLLQGSRNQSSGSNSCQMM